MQRPLEASKSEGSQEERAYFEGGFMIDLFTPPGQQQECLPGGSRNAIATVRQALGRLQMLPSQNNKPQSLRVLQDFITDELEQKVSLRPRLNLITCFYIFDILAFWFWQHKLWWNFARTKLVLFEPSEVFVCYKCLYFSCYSSSNDSCCHAYNLRGA